MPNLKLTLDHSGDDHSPVGDARSKRHLLRTTARGLGLGVLLVVVLLVAAVFATARSGDRTLWPPAPGTPTTEIHVVSHGYHAGIIIPRASLHDQASRRGRAALGAMATRFDRFDRLEIGWGDEGFYRAVPTLDSLTVPLALRALLRPGNPSVLHVVGIPGDPRVVFVNSEIVRLELSATGFDKLADKLDASFAHEANGDLFAPLGPGLYGTSLFFRANGAFHLFNVCNHWVASLLDAAGVPTAPVLATLPPGLLLDLEWRSGLPRLPKSPAPGSGK
jgi:uncharacterized protein (TIGR02117 family)